MGSVLTAVNTILELLAAFIEWGQDRKIFNDNQAVIALSILRKAQKDIKVAQDIEDKLNREFDADPTSVLTPDKYTRNDPDSP